MSSGHVVAAVQAARKTPAPIGTIKPVSSATEMKSPGETRPDVGWFHRKQFSLPTVYLKVAQQQACTVAVGGIDRREAWTG